MEFMKYPSGSWFNRQNDIKGRINLMSQEKLARLLIDRPELRPADDPAFMQLLKLAKQDPQDVDIQEMLAQKIAVAQQAYEASGDPFWGNMPAVRQSPTPAQFVRIGTTSNGIEVGLDYRQLSFTNLILGPTGWGKTTTLMAELANPDLLQSVCIVILVKKPEWRGFLSLPEYADLVRIFQLSDLSISLAQPPTGMSKVKWINEESKFIGQNYERLAAHRLFNEALQEMCQEFPEGKYPALSQIIDAIDSSKAHGFSRRADLKESILSCLKDLYYSVDGMFEYSSSTFLEELFSHPGLNVIEAMTLPPEHLSFLSTYLTRWIYCKRLTQKAEMIIIMIIDDATVNVCKAKDASNPGGIAPIPEAVIMSRALGIGFIFLIHSYSAVSEIIQQNTQSLIIKGLPGEDMYVLKNRLGFNQDQIELTKDRLGINQAVFINRGQGLKPVLIRIDKPNIPDTCSPELVRQVADAFLSRVKTTPPYPIAMADASKSTSSHKTSQSKNSGFSATPGVPVADAKELEFLKLAAQVPPLPLSSIYQKLGLSKTQGRRLVNKVSAQGFIVLHSLATGRRGGKIVLPQPTDAAWLLLEQNAHHRPKDHSQGSWLHKMAAALIAAEGRAQRETVTFEVVLDGCRIDVLRVNTATHQRTFYNIGLSSWEYEAEAVIKFFATSAAAGARFVLVTESAAFAQKVMDCLKQTAEGKNVLNRFTTRLIGSFVNV